MFENFKLFRNWYKLARPNKKIWTISSLSVVLVYACILIALVFSAKVVVAITSGDYIDAVINLSIVFGLLLLRNAFWHINYYTYSKLVGSVYGRLNDEFIQKILKANPCNFYKTSKEKLINIVHSDIFSLAEIADKFAICCGRIFMLIATIIIIFVINPWVGLTVILVDILNFIVLNALEKRRSRCVKKIREDRDQQYQQFCEIIDTRDTINELSLNNSLGKKYRSGITNYRKNLHRKTMADSSIAQGFFVFYSFIIFVLTLGMVFLLYKEQLSVEMYFIIVAYITSGIETTNLVFEFIPYMKNSGIYCSRIKDVLNFTEKNNLCDGDIDLDDVIGYIDLDNVYYNGDDNNPAVSDITLRIKGLQTTYIIGASGSGKRTLFHLMHRDIRPTSGEVSMDGLNILEYSKRVFSKNFSFLGTVPTFFNESILQNLKMVNSNLSNINAVCEQVGLMPYIKSLPQKMRTNILSLPYEKQYLLGLARALLTGAEAIALYELPNNLTKSEKNNIKQALLSIQGKRTLIIFSANSDYISVADKVVTMENGSIKEIAFTNNRPYLGWRQRDI